MKGRPWLRRAVNNCITVFCGAPRLVEFWWICCFALFRQAREQGYVGFLLTHPELFVTYFFTCEKDLLRRAKEKSR